jgi:hypothetical protein
MSILVKKSKESYALTPSRPIQATTSSIQDIYFKAGLTSYCEVNIIVDAKGFYEIKIS